jgi:hypothetical protein
MSQGPDNLHHQVEVVPWRFLAQQLQADAYIVVEQDMDLVSVGLEIVNDNRERVQEWVARGKLNKPTLQQVEAWNQAPEKTFKTLITHPYILIQEMLDH